MTSLLRLMLLVLLAATAPVVGAKPERIVSIGLCTDQLLLMLAERDQIASVSLWASDPNMSYMLDAVGDIPSNNASIEEILRFEPDLVLASEFVGWDTIRLLRQLGYRVEQLPVATSIEQIYTQLRQFGDWTGNPDSARLAIAQMQAELAATRARYAHRPARSVIIYAPNGYTSGANTLEHDLFVQAGYRNLAAEMGIDGFRAISLETLVAADPDVLLIDRRLSQQVSLATARLTHPVLDKLLREREFLDIPTPLRICAGPMITEAVERMAARR